MDEEVVPLTHDIELTETEAESRHRHSENHDVEKAPPPAPKGPVGRNIPWMSLPNKDQLFLLALCRLSEPMSNTCLLPYIYYLMKSIIIKNGENPNAAQNKKIAELSGILVAVFPLAQLATSMLWARLADSHGRRKVIIGALLVSAISNLGFGFSRSFWGLMFWRTLAGLANGNVGVMRTMTAEIVKEKKYEIKAYLLLPLIFNAGMVFGLVVGGFLADPVVNLAWLFGPTGLLNFGNHPDGVEFALKYPYSFPAMLNFMLLATSMILAVFGLKETLQGSEDHNDIGLQFGRTALLWAKQHLLPARFQRYSAIALRDVPESPIGLGINMEAKNSATSRAQPIPRSSPPKQIWTRDVICASVSFSLLPLHNSAFMHIFPVFLSNLPAADTSRNTTLHFNGGLGLRSSSIGLYLSLFGLLGIFLQLFIYPRLQARLGTLGVFRISQYIFPLTYLFAPFLVLLPQSGALRWICIAVIAWSQIMARTLAIPSTVILLTNSAPTKSVLGRIHGAGNSGASLARCIGPALGGWIFAKGMQGDMVGMVWWYYLFVVAGAALAWSFTMRPPAVH